MDSTPPLSGLSGSTAGNSSGGKPQPSTQDWLNWFRGALGSASNEILISLDSPGAYGFLDSPELIQALRERLRACPPLQLKLMVESVEPVRRAWPRWAEAARWYAHQMQALIVPIDLPRSFELVAFDRRTVGYAPWPQSQVADPGRWRLTQTKGNPAAVTALESTVSVLDRSAQASWSPLGL
ncbi:hypothetical protein [Piscinibacterium candidicorallinum]|uniref:Uncharacterized protein n=1 Tax=Piscinibacterium candidicorallinum TaxID=1793872 RepID=A0ABV7H1D6_9BURK